MKSKTCVVVIILILVAGVGTIFLLSQNEQEEPPFDNERRYDSTILSNMGVIYDNQSDIAHWNNGYSETDECPWGAIHNGLDNMFYNDSPVIAAAPGLVTGIGISYLPNNTYYKVAVAIQFNETGWLEYSFEDDANESMRAQQVAMRYVEIGDWVAKRKQIARFLRAAEYDHVHFAVYLDGEAICPWLVMGQADYDEIMILVDSFHPDWELCELP